MTTFDKREEGFEKKFAVDEELKFKANARRNRLLGLWAAAKLGLSGAEADAYAKEVVVADFEEAGEEVLDIQLLMAVAGGLTLRRADRLLEFLRETIDIHFFILEHCKAWMRGCAQGKGPAHL